MYAELGDGLFFCIVANIDESCLIKTDCDKLIQPMLKSTGDHHEKPFLSKKIHAAYEIVVSG